MNTDYSQFSRMTMDVQHHRNVTAASSSPPSSRYSPPTAIEVAQQVTSLPTAATLHQRPQKRSFDVAFLMAPDDLSKRRPRPPPVQPVVRSAFTKVHSPDPPALSPGSSPPLEFGGYLHHPLQHHHLQQHHHQNHQQHVQQQQQECSLSPPLPPPPPVTAAHFMSPFPLGFRTPFAMMMPTRPQPTKDYPQQQQQQPQQQQQQLPSPSPLQFGPAAAAAAAVAALPAMLLPASIAAAALTLPSQNVCAKCNVSFRMTSDLVYHMRSHHKGDGAGSGAGSASAICGSAGPDGKKRRDTDKLRCPVCDESFRERHHLTRHMTAHQDKEGDRLDDEDDAPPPPSRPPLLQHQQGAK